MCRYKILTLIFFLLAAFGCAATPPPPLMYWPAPPEEPRIAFVNSYRGEIDFRQKSFLDFFFGVEARVQIQKPYGVVAVGDKIFVALTQTAQVIILDTKEKNVSYLDTSGAGNLSQPLGMAVSSDGTIFVSDVVLKRIFGYDQTGKLKVAIGKKGELGNPAGLAINNELKRLYVADSSSHMVEVYSTSGEFLMQFGRRGDGDGEFNYPSNVAIDKRNGNVYVVDTQNFRVQVFDKDGRFMRKFGALGDAPGFFSRPKGIGIDSEGHAYVVDAAFNNVQIFDEAGSVLLYFGGQGRAPGYFQLPSGLFVDANDRIYVSDQFNARVQVFQYLSGNWKKEHPDEYKKYLVLPEEPKKEEGTKK